MLCLEETSKTLPSSDWLVMQEVEAVEALLQSREMSQLYYHCKAITTLKPFSSPRAGKRTFRRVSREVYSSYTANGTSNQGTTIFLRLPYLYIFCCSY